MDNIEIVSIKVTRMAYICVISNVKCRKTFILKP